MSPHRTILITAAVQREKRIDWEALRANDDPRVGGMQVAAQQVEREVVEVTADAWRAAGLAEGHGAVASAVYGTAYGTHHTSEYLVATLADRGAKWLNPEAFLRHAPHSSVGMATHKLRVHGPSVTVVGPDAGREALLQAARTVAMGRAEVVICGAFDWPSPFAAWAGDRMGVKFNPSCGHAVCLIVEAEGHARERGARPLARAVWSPARVRGGEAPDAPVDPTLPLRRVTNALSGGAPERLEVCEQLAVEPVGEV